MYAIYYDVLHIGDLVKLFNSLKRRRSVFARIHLPRIYRLQTVGPTQIEPSRYVRDRGVVAFIPFFPTELSCARRTCDCRELYTSVEYYNVSPSVVGYIRRPSDLCRRIEYVRKPFPCAYITYRRRNRDRAG